ncbi:MAG: hypothetical protein EPO22_04755, partial [Dehalococcoidia bacterium]
AEIRNTASAIGADAVTLAATGSHVADTKAEAGGEGGDVGIGGAVAIAVIDNVTTASIGSGAELDITGNFGATATHHGVSTTTADGTAAGDTAVGAAIGLAFVDNRAISTAGRNVRANGSVSLAAHGDGKSVVLAKASAKGADKGEESTENGNTKADDQKDDQVALANGKSGDGDSVGQTAEDGSGGDVSVAAALALNVTDSEASARIGNGGTIIAGDGVGTGNLTLAASNNMDATATADGSAATGDSGTAVGIAVAINVADMTNEALIGDATVTAEGVSATASMKNLSGDQKHLFEAKATSGASGGDTGVAGSFALNVSDTTTEAAVKSLASVTISDANGDVSLAATNTSESTVEAKATTGGANTGVGISIGINVVDNMTTAEIEASATLSGADDLSLSATGSHKTATTATSGAEAGDGTGVGGAFAITVADNVTVARLTTGGLIDLGGALSATATHHGDSATTADGTALGADAAIGAAIALAFIDDSATATTARNITADGNISFAAHGDGKSVVVAKASAAGADDDDQGDNATADDQKTKQTNTANSKSGDGDSSPKDATTEGGGGGSVSVAAALALNVASSIAVASINDGVTIVAGDGVGIGSLNLHASNNMDATAKADGSAKTTDGGTAVGIAVAINVADMTNEASVGAGANVSADGLTISATMKNVGGDFTHRFGAESTSGASEGDIGVAGSFALNVAETDTIAAAGLDHPGGPSGAATVTLSGGNVSMTATNTTENIVAAKSKAEGGNVGVGAAIAINVALNDTFAGIENGERIIGNTGGFNAAATSTDTVTTTAEAGAAGDTSVGGAIAIAYVEDATEARIGTGDAGFLGDDAAIVLTGNLGAQATYTGTIHTTSDGEAAGGDVGVGVSLSLNILTVDTTAFLGRSFSGAGNITVTSTSTLDTKAESKASAKGADSSDSDSDTKTSNKTAAAQDQSGGSAAPSQNKSSSVGTADSNSSEQSGSSSQGGTSVAATISVNYLDVANTATIAADVVIGSTGVLKVEAIGQFDGRALATATSTDTSSSTGVAAAVGLNIVVMDNIAQVGAGADLTADSIAVRAITPVGQKNTFQARALSGAASSGTAVGGSVSVNYLDLETRAAVGNNADLDATAGGINIAATSLNEMQSIAGGAALSLDSGTGVGVAVAINIVNDLDTRAEVGNNVIADATGSISVTAHAELLPVTESLPLIGSVGVTSFAAGIGGSSGGTGVGGSSSINVIDTMETHASVGSDTDLDAGTGITVQATDLLTIFSGAGGMGLSTGNAGVGIGLDVQVITRNTTASVGSRSDLDTTSGNILINADSHDDITSIAATFGASTDGAGVAASIGVVVLLTDTLATVADGTSLNRTRLDAGGDVTVRAEGDADVFMLAGGLAYGNSAGIGIASTVFVHTDNVIASIGTFGGVTTGGANGLNVESTSIDDVLLIAAAGGMTGGSVGVGGSVIVSVMTETTKATVGSSTTVTATDAGIDAPGARVYADSDTDILAVAGAIGVAAGSAGIGAGVNVHTLTKTTEAHIASSANVEAEGNVTVEAVSDEVMKTFSLAAGGGSSIGVGISADVYVFDLTTRAYIGNSAIVRTEGSVLVQARDETEADLIVGGASVGGTGGVSAAVGVAVIDKIVDAYIGTSAHVTGEGHDAVSARTGKFVAGVGSVKSGVSESDLSLSGGARPDSADLEVGTPAGVGMTDKDADNDGTNDVQDNPGLSAEQTSEAAVNANFRGVAVSASSKDDVESMSFSLAAGGTFGVGVAAAVNVVDVDTTATIGQFAQINQSVTGSADTGQSVLIAAASDFNHVGIGVGAAVGGSAGVAPGVDVSVVEVTTKAQLGASTMVDARDDVAVIATAEESFLIIAAGIAASGTFALGGGVSVITVNDETLASIGDSADVEAGGDVAVLAEDDSTVTIITGGVGIGIGGAGIGASVGIGLFDKTTDAIIGADAIINAKGTGTGYDGILNGDVGGDGSFTRGTAHGVIVQADSTESFTNVSFAGAGGVYAGIAGAIGVTMIDSDTTAQIGANAQINQGSGNFAVGANGVDPDQGVWVGASNRVSLLQLSLGVAGGIAGIAGAVS